MKAVLPISLLALGPIVAAADVPFVFQAGQPARSSEVNANFEALDERIAATLSDIEILYEFAEGEMLASAFCPTDTIAISASCACSSEDGARNLGVLASCGVIGVGAMGTCFPDANTFTIALPFPQAHVTATCAAAIREDGSSTISWRDSETSDLAGASKPAPSSPYAEGYAELMRAVSAAQAEIERYKLAVQNR